MADGLEYRDARPSEDDELARIIYNAFLPVWNHNWWDCLSAPLPIIPRNHHGPLTSIQSRRLAFYKSWIKLNRAHDGEVIVAQDKVVTTTTADDGDSGKHQYQHQHQPNTNTIAAVVLLLPPHARPTWLEPLLAYRTDFLQSLFRLGLRGIWRACVTFDGEIQQMIGRGLKRLEIADGKQEGLLFCQCCVRNPEWQGVKGPGRKLFDWGVRRFWRDKLQVPVWLDVSTEKGLRAYREIGFQLVDECTIDAGTDEKGFELKKNATDEQREAGLKATKLWVMVRMPDTDSREMLRD